MQTIGEATPEGLFPYSRNTFVRKQTDLLLGVFRLVFELRFAPRAFGREAAEFATCHDFTQGFATIWTYLRRLVGYFFDAFNIFLVGTVRHCWSPFTKHKL